MTKTELRKDIKSRLAAMDDICRAEQSRKICAALTQLKEFRRSGVIMVFLSLPHEIDTVPIILNAWQQGKTVAVPKISWQQRHMIPVQINSLETGFSTDGFGLKNPTTGLPVPIEDIDFVVTPGLGFDRKGNRLGRGGGYFDRFFSNDTLKAVRCGVCFSEQLVDEVPTVETDIPVDMLITDKEFLIFNQPR